MIANLTGKITHRESNWIILEVGGIGYQVFMPTNLQTNLDDSLKLYCSHQIREDSQTLYGFATFHERSLFELLLTVSGVGPKSALVILSAGKVEQIERAIINGDPGLFESVSGIGKKLAAKIIVELKGRLDSSGGSLLPVENFADHELVTALEGLGYRRGEILTVIRSLPADVATLQEKIRWALKHLSRHS